MDFNFGSVRNQAPDLLNFGVRDRDAAFGPIGQNMRFANIRLAIGEAVDHDIAARIDATPSRRGAIRRVRIGDPQGSVKCTRGIASTMVYHPAYSRRLAESWRQPGSCPEPKIDTMGIV